MWPVLNEARDPDTKEMPHKVPSHLSAADFRRPVWRVVDLGRSLPCYVQLEQIGYVP